MKALVTDNYGDSTVLRFDDVPDPVLGADDVLIKVHYSTVNRTDTGVLSGTPWFARLVFGLRRPKVRIRGCEFSGTVIAVGAQSGEFNIGDEVMGFYDEGARCHAELCAIHKRFVSAIPTGITLENAGSIERRTFLRS